MLLIIIFFMENCFSFEELDIDSFISYSLRWRVSEHDPRLLGVASIPKSGTAYSVNNDDGNLNYNRGNVENFLKLENKLNLPIKIIDNVSSSLIFNQDFYLNFGYKNNHIKSRVLDFYVANDFYINNSRVILSIGKQSIEGWGNYIINPINIRKTLLPKTDFSKINTISVNMFRSLIKFSKNHTFDLFYQYDWKKTETGNNKNYFSTNDFSYEGGSFFSMGQGMIGDTVPFMRIKRHKDEYPRKLNQYGLAWIWSVLNENRIIKFYYINYHSNLPIINAKTGTKEGMLTASHERNFMDFINTYGNTAGYFLSFPENIQLIGIDFNKKWKNIIIDSKYRYTKNSPFQIDDSSLLYAALGSVNKEIASINQVGNYYNKFEKKILGYRLHNSSSLSLKFSYISKIWLTFFRVEFEKIHGMAKKNQLKYESDGTYLTGNKNLSKFQFIENNITEEDKNFAGNFSWGYSLFIQKRIKNIFNNIKLYPRIVWNHNVKGNSPKPAAIFLSGRKELSFGLNMKYNKKLNIDISYTNYFGAGAYNLINDRDNISFSVKYHLY